MPKRFRRVLRGRRVRWKRGRSGRTFAGGVWKGAEGVAEGPDSQKKGAGRDLGVCAEGIDGVRRQNSVPGSEIPEEGEERLFDEERWERLAALPEPPSEEGAPM